MDLSSFTQVNTWLLEYVYETVWTFFDEANDVPLALRFLVDGCLQFDSEKLLREDSPVVMKMLCVLKCLLLTINADDDDDAKDPDASSVESTSCFEELLEQFVTLEEVDEELRELIAHHAVAKCIADGDFTKAQSCLSKVSSYLSPILRTVLTTGIDAKKSVQEPPLQDLQNRMVRFLRHHFAPSLLFRSSNLRDSPKLSSKTDDDEHKDEEEGSGKSFLLETADKFLEKQKLDADRSEKEPAAKPKGKLGVNGKRKGGKKAGEGVEEEEEEEEDDKESRPTRAKVRKSADGKAAEAERDVNNRDDGGDDNDEDHGLRDSPKQTKNADDRARGDATNDAPRGPDDAPSGESREEEEEESLQEAQKYASLDDSRELALLNRGGRDEELIDVDDSAKNEDDEGVDSENRFGRTSLKRPTTGEAKDAVTSTAVPPHQPPPPSSSNAARGDAGNEEQNTQMNNDLPFFQGHHMRRMLLLLTKVDGGATDDPGKREGGGHASARGRDDKEATDGDPNDREKGGNNAMDGSEAVLEKLVAKCDKRTTTPADGEVERAEEKEEEEEEKKMMKRPSKEVGDEEKEEGKKRIKRPSKEEEEKKKARNVGKKGSETSSSKSKRTPSISPQSSPVFRNETFIRKSRAGRTNKDEAPSQKGEDEKKKEGSSEGGEVGERTGGSGRKERNESGKDARKGGGGAKTRGRSGEGERRDNDDDDDVGGTGKSGRTCSRTRNASGGGAKTRGRKEDDEKENVRTIRDAGDEEEEEEEENIRNSRPQRNGAIVNYESEEEEEEEEQERPPSGKKSGVTKAKTSKKSDEVVVDDDVEDDEDDDESNHAAPVAEKKTEGKARDQPSRPPTTPPPSASSDTTKRHQWTYDESVNIWKGVQKYGEGNWSKIMESYKFHPSRTNVSVKDRWRTMSKTGLDHKIARDYKKR